MKKFFLLILLYNFFTIGQSLTGKKICLDPGHGFIPGQAYVCNDAETKRFEGWMNHIVVPYLKRYLQKAGAIITQTRADYDSVSACITLTQRKTIANNANVDWFHSVHHNAYLGTSNYTLLLFKQLDNLSCPIGNPQWVQAVTMAQIMAPRIYQAWYTTSSTVAGDMCFLGYNLGVLSTLNMPGTLSEGSFWDYPAEILRLKNVDYLKTEAEAIYHSFLQYYGVSLPAHGSLVGIVNNSIQNAPAKNVKVQIESLGLQYMVDNIGNGFYRFDSLAPGTYTVKVTSSIDTTYTSVNVQGSKINKANLSIRQADIMPDIKLLTVIASNTSLMLSWQKPSILVDTYKVWLSTDGVTWQTEANYNVLGTAGSYTIGNLQSGQSYYVRVKAKNSISESQNFSKVYGAYTSTSSEKVLIVDGFNRFGGTGSWTLPYHNFVALYGDALKNKNIKFESVSNSAIQNYLQLSGYKYIIWFLGDESRTDTTFSASEQNIIKEYLKNGGNFFTTGSEIAFDLDLNGTTTSKEFINQFLKAAYVADNPSPNNPIANGVAGTFLDGMTIPFGITYPEDWPDVISPVGSTTILGYNSTQFAGIAYSGIFPGGTTNGKVVYISFAVETISDKAIRDSLIIKTINYFKEPVSVNEINSYIPAKFDVKIFPNPFNPSTTIQFDVVKENNYKISVFDILGKKIKEVFTGKLKIGTYNFNIDMSANSSGTYILNVSSGDYVDVKKLVLIK